MSAVLVFGAVELRLDERRLLVEGQPVALGSRAFDLLKALVNKRERVVGKDELLDEVWPGLIVEENNLQVQISGLRRVLGQKAIATVAGQGYRFTLAAEPSVTTPAALDVLAPASGRVAPAAVLVADDNKVNRLLLCRSLELMGHRVSSAENGRQALALLRERRFDLLLLDLAMPEMDGFAMLEVRAQEPALREVAVIVTSALDGVAPAARCIELGADDFLHKPVDPWLLKARVEASLARQAQRAQELRVLRRHRSGGPEQASLRTDMTVMVARLRGLDASEPHAAMELLGHWATLMLDAIEAGGGELVQFGGDALRALFADPRAALRVAGEMSQVLALFNAERAAARHGALVMATGLAHGTVLTGSAATPRRVAFVCAGAPVWQAEWLLLRCEREGRDLLMDEALQEAL